MVCEVLLTNEIIRRVSFGGYRAPLLYQNIRRRKKAALARQYGNFVSLGPKKIDSICRISAFYRRNIFHCTESEANLKPAGKRIPFRQRKLIAFRTRCFYARHNESISQTFAAAREPVAFFLC